ncbi:bifunctional nuclease family protein [Nakamurella lactea]|uniref:bifunctional nuclease family protein n=1 Tax=Nakamurella lactea TaxID=459515 RepID=UPI0004126B6D|nr:bifunctional nuclease family protein [Nakamurella lactea]
MIEMRIVGVRIEMPSQQPILVLTEKDGPRSLPIVIGTVEATAIAMHLQGMRPARPLTHDLLGQVISALGRSVEQVRVVDFREGTFYGELAFDDGTSLSARPSDAVALAVRIDCPVFVADELLDQAGIVLDDVDEVVAPMDEEAMDPDVDPDEEVQAFREFLDSVSPDDFGPEDSGPS